MFEDKIEPKIYETYDDDAHNFFEEEGYSSEIRY